MRDFEPSGTVLASTGNDDTRFNLRARTIIVVARLRDNRTEQLQQIPTIVHLYNSPRSPIDDVRESVS